MQRKTHPLYKMVNNSMVDLPAPSNISYWWNMGSLLGMFLLIQFFTGIFLAMHYAPNTLLAFKSMIHISREVNWGWLLHSAHMNGASMFFLLIYIHMARGIYFKSYTHRETWNLGLLIFILSMATAFMGYVLPWGQMSFWGATVITNIFSAIPYIGQSLVEYLWGGFAVSNPTLNRFFSLHFIFPFMIALLAGLHLLFLHSKGSSNPLGLNTNLDRIPFHPYFIFKDILGFTTTATLFMLLITFSPNLFMDPENYIEANPLSTPTHIQPEWYFLWLYAILRSIPNKLGGVLALLSAIILLFTLSNKTPLKSNSMKIFSTWMFWTLVASWIILTWVGSMPVEEPFIFIAQIVTITYFSFFIISPHCKY